MLSNFRKSIRIILANINDEVSSHRVIYFLLSTVLLTSLFVRIYRTEDLLGFYYDQGRDALVIWKLLHEGKPFLIGPVTGLAGIFLGPLYYYLIAPFYLIGGGDPGFPAIFLSLTTVFALMILYYLAWKMHSRIAGLIAVVIGGLSYYLVLAARWLSNPTPMFLLSMLILWNMWSILTKDNVSNINRKLNWSWISLALLLGISLQFESASAIFYIPMFVVFAIWQWKKLPNFRTLLFAILIFLFTFLPQILFDLRHDHVIYESFKRVLVAEKSFRNPINSENIEFKKTFFWNILDSKIFPGYVKWSKLFYLSALLGITVLFLKKHKEIILLLIFLGVPLIGYFIFQGNEGHIYDYYTTGYYFPLILLFSVGLSVLWKNFFGKILILYFLFVFLNLNIKLIRNYLTAPYGGSVGISLGTELQAIDWIYRQGNCEGILRYTQDDKSTCQFNVDIYVPPVIPHSYEYLLNWRGDKFCGDSLCGYITNKNVPVLYTLFEEDPPHPERLGAWLSRQKGIGFVEEEKRFGNITVQRRLRI